MTGRRLGDLAHARAGDKGDSSILFIAPDDPADFAELERRLTPEVLASHFRVGVDAVTVRPAPALSAFSIVIAHRLDGGVTRSRTADPHGKTLSAHLLDLRIPFGGATLVP